MDPTGHVTIAGEHLPGFDDDDVSSVIINTSNTPFMIPQIFTSFPNVHYLSIRNSNLESIIVPDTVQLQTLFLSNNNISRLESGTLNGQRSLTSLTIQNDEIEVIEENAFDGLEQLEILNLRRNKISRILPGTFDRLTKLRTLDMDRNQLTRIDDLFSNTQMFNLFMEHNQINEVSPQFLNTIQNSLDYVNFSNNRCINLSVFVRDEVSGLETLSNALKPCFENFGDEISETRRITMEFHGPLSLFDESGNLIVKIN